MRKALGAGLTLGLILTGGLTRLCQGATADGPETNLTITIYVYNYAEVSAETLREAEKIAHAIFQKAGVKIRWCDKHLKKNNERSAEPEPFFSSDIALHILPHSMTESFGLMSERLGLAPGRGPNRSIAYVFSDRAEQLAQQQRAAQIVQALAGRFEPCASIGQILGLVIAHELGHLLGFETHFSTGVMRADWDSADLQKGIFGKLLFTPQQAEIMRAAVSRRIGRQETTQQDGTALKLRTG